MDATQIRLLRQATQETDSTKLLELVEEVLARFGDEGDPYDLLGELPVRRCPIRRAA